MQPVIVIPMNDPSGLMFPHLKAITPLLQTVFAHAFVSVNASTRQAHPESMAWLKSEAFFRVLYHPDDPPVGDDFLALYRHAASSSSREQILHLCYIDRVAFALQSSHKDSFITDIQTAGEEYMPLIFQRSEKAWSTHPSNYRQIEQMVSDTGNLLFHKVLDFAWCHLAATASQLENILPQVKNHDLSMVAEIVVLLKDSISTREVDWLAWEDPFILNRDPQELKNVREHSLQETRKRLSYAVPMLQILYEELK